MFIFLTDTITIIYVYKMVMVSGYLLSVRNSKILSFDYPKKNERKIDSLLIILYCIVLVNFGVYFILVLFENINLCVI